MKKLIAAALSILMVLAMASCGQNDIPDVSIPTDEELDALIGEYSTAESGSEALPESSAESETESSSPSESSAAEEQSSAAAPSQPGELTPEIYSSAPGGQSASSGTAQPGESAEISEEGHAITEVIAPFLVSDDVIAEGKKNGVPPDPRPTELICTISVSCSTAIATGVNNKAGFTHLPSDGWILRPVTVSYSEGETVFSVLARVLQEAGTQMEYEGTAGLQYVEGIDNLYEFDGGRWSGWMYCVNQWYPNFGSGQYTIDPGDVIEWNYTCDLGEDLGQYWMGG